MTSNAINPSNIQERRMALIAGASLILMTIVAIYSFGYVHETLIVSNDAVTTLENLQSYSKLFSGEIVGWVLIFLLDILVAWSLFHFLKRTSKALSFLSSFLRIVYTAVLGIAIFHLAKVLTVIDKPASEDLGQQVIGYAQSFEYIWSIGLIVFGLHLLALGYLAFRSDYVPWVWGVLLMLAGASYTLQHGMEALSLPTSESLEMILSIPMVLGELGFAVWLLWKGGKSGKK